MYVLAKGRLADKAEKQYAKQGRPHIEEIQTVEAVGDHQHVSRKGGGGRFGAADENDEVTCKAADGGVEKGTAETAEGEVIGDQLCGGGENAEKVFPEIRLARDRYGDRGRDKEREAEKAHVEGDDPTRVFCMMHFRIVSGKLNFCRLHVSFCLSFKKI